MNNVPAIHVYNDEPDYGSLADALDEFYGIAVEQPTERERALHREAREHAELIDCPRCHGSGEIQFNLSRNRDPQCDDSALCNVCHGDGMVHPSDLENEDDARAASTAGRHDQQETES